MRSSGCGVGVFVGLGVGVLVGTAVGVNVGSGVDVGSVALHPVASKARARIISAKNGQNARVDNISFFFISTSPKV